MTSKALQLIADERQRQMDVEGWTLDHDDSHDGGELAQAAACYAVDAGQVSHIAPGMWPWDPKWWKPASRAYDLVRAGALIVAELERLQRLKLADQERIEGFTPEKPIRLRIGHRATLQVSDFADASRQYLDLQNASGEGCTTWPLGRLYAGTQEIGRISYNGRIWPPIDGEFKDRPLYEPTEDATAPKCGDGVVNQVDEHRALKIKNWLETRDNQLMAGDTCRDTHEGCERALHNVYLMACGKEATS